MERGEHKKLSYSEFQKLAGVTESPKFHANIMNVSTMHGIIGIQTEVSELLEAQTRTFLNIANVREEIGDILWYVSAVTRSEKWKIELKEFEKTDSIFDSTIYLIVASGQLVDIVKKGIFYSREPDVNLIREIIEFILEIIIKMCGFYDWDIREIMAENISKLKQRYPEQFTSYHAQERLDKQ